MLRAELGRCACRGGPSGPSPASLTTHLRIDHQDGLGSVRALTDENGTLVGTLTSDAFGANPGQSGVQPQPFGYAGQQVDSTGLVFLRARYYDPSVGRFMSQDSYPGSAGSPLSLNRYTYVLNSPTLTADPSGMSPSNKVLGKSCYDTGDQLPWWCHTPLAGPCFAAG